MLIVVPNPQHALTTFSILLQVECELQMERVYEWLLRPCRTFGGFCLLHIRNRAFLISGSWTYVWALRREWGLELGGGWMGRSLEDEWIGTVGRHTCV